MVKYFWIYLICLLILKFDISKASGDDICIGEERSTRKECNSLLNEDTVEDGVVCCLVKGKRDDQDVSECHLYIEEEYINKEGFVSYLEDNEFIENPKVDCKSYYLQLTLLTIILIFV